MDRFLIFMNGSIEGTRGWAIICTRSDKCTSDSQSLYWYILVDIHGIALREAIEEGLSNGKFIREDMMESSFVNLQYMDTPLTFKELEEKANNDTRDLILDNSSSNLEPPLEMNVVVKNRLEVVASKYITVHKENVFLRITQQIHDDIFRSSRGKEIRLYPAFFVLVQHIYLLLRAYRDKDQIDIDYMTQRILKLNLKLPGIQVSDIIQIMAKGTYEAWEEVSTMMDAYFLSLRTNIPCSYHLFSKRITDIDKLISGELFSLYFEFFSAVLQEDYEKAREFKEQIDNYNESLEECRE